jgi:hypothetical protein
MIPLMSQVKHNPPHSYGDCLRASIASILNIEPVQTVPHFFEDGCSGEVATARIREYVKTLGILPFVWHIDASVTQAEVLEFQAEVNPGVYYLLFGRDGNGGQHCVVCLDNKIIHNTAWHSTGLPSPDPVAGWGIMTFVKDLK